MLEVAGSAPTITRGETDLLVDDVVVVEPAPDEVVNGHTISNTGPGIQVQFLLLGYEGASADAVQDVWLDASKVQWPGENAQQWCFNLPAGRMSVSARVRRPTTVSHACIPVPFLVRGKPASR